ncbi:MAG TPA: sigma-54 dependent transcriptional regulator [Planctomycetota bacterium]|nr:sigma-54 dependent transcriptional regulator [Planctomycetota bacterium]
MPEKTRVLVLDDDRGHAEAAAESLERAGYECRAAGSGTEGLRILQEEGFDVVLTDLVMRDVSGIEIVRKVKARTPETEVIVMTGYPSYETALEAMDEGAYDYLNKPIDLNILRAKIRKALEKQKLFRSNIELKRQLDKRYGFEGIIGGSESMQSIFDTLRQVAPTTATVLILGESGTGKELVARAIHENSPRRGNHFVPLNCAALSETILESELFGYEKGAFTGALQTRKGRFEYAHGGTLFLDEIGDMPPSIQIKLLRVIEYGEVFRVGSNDRIKVDVRLIAATNKDLTALIREGTFREDLFYRLKVVTVEMPPLRDRLEDLPPLVQSFLDEFASQQRKRPPEITPAAMEFLYDYSWPGNVRELRNCIESMVVLDKDGRIDVEDVPRYVRQPAQAGSLPGVAGVNLEEGEKERIRKALAMCEGNREKAAKMLGIGERTLYRKIKRFGFS